YQDLLAGYGYAHAANLRLRTPAAAAAYLAAARARTAAVRAYTVDPGVWGQAASYAAAAYQSWLAVYQAGGDCEAFLAYLSEHLGWLNARAAAASSGEVNGLVALTSDGHLLSFDPAAPGAVTRDVAVTGLAHGDVLHTLVVSPQGTLYGIA